MSSQQLQLIREKQKKRRELLAKQLGVSGADQLHIALNSKSENLQRENLVKANNLNKSAGGSGHGHLTKKQKTHHKKDNSSKSKSRDNDDPASKVDVYKDSSTFLKGTQSLNPHNDYCQNYVDTGQRPQNYIRDVGLADRFEEYPKLKDLITLKNELIRKTNTPPMYLKCDLDTFDLRDLGSKFEVILIEPPLEEYQRQGALPLDYKCFSWQDIMSLEIEEIAGQRSFVFLWCGSSDGLDYGRQCLRKWGFRRCEDICWIKTNLKNKNPKNMEQGSLLSRSKEHCLMGIKGTVRRSTDGDFIHANVDIDLIIEEEREFGNTEKPEEIFHIIEHFCLSRRRLHLFGRDSSLRPGWVTIGRDLTNSNYNCETYNNYFVSNDENVDGTLTGCTEEISRLRPKTPPPRDGSHPGSTRGGTSNRGGLHGSNRGLVHSNRRNDGFNKSRELDRNREFDSYNSANAWKHNRTRGRGINNNRGGYKR